MPNVVSALTARSQLGQKMRRVIENNERFVVDRHGEPQVIIMSVDDFIRTIAPPIWAESKRKGLNKLTMREINGEIAACRPSVDHPAAPVAVVERRIRQHVVGLEVVPPAGNANYAWRQR